MQQIHTRFYPFAFVMGRKQFIQNRKQKMFQTWKMRRNSNAAQPISKNPRKKTKSFVCHKKKYEQNRIVQQFLFIRKVIVSKNSEKFKNKQNNVKKTLMEKLLCRTISICFQVLFIIIFCTSLVTIFNFNTVYTQKIHFVCFCRGPR